MADAIICLMTTAAMRPSRVLACALSAQILVVAFVGAYAHRAYAEHAYCTEHGAVIHAAPRAGAPPAADGRARLTAGATLAGAHNCALLAFLTAGFADLRAPDADRTWRGPARHGPRPRRAPRAAIALLRLSPKHSPPAA